MESIRLPKDFPGDLDLAALNRRLRAGEICLDWTGVTASIQPERLATLFSGLNLAEHLEEIGGATIPDALQPAILSAFEALADGDEPAQGKSNGVGDNMLASVGPTIWQPEATPDNKEAEMEDEDIYEGKVDEGEPGEGEAREPTQVQEAPRPILEVPSESALRDELQQMVLRDLLGPAGGEDEELDVARVRERYLVGMLAPTKVQTDPEQQDDRGPADESGEDSPVDIDAKQMTSLSPSSIGMSFCVDSEATDLLVTARWGHYLRERSPDKTTPRGSPLTIWRRRQRGGQPKRFPLTEGHLERWQPEVEEQPDVHVEGLVRRSGEGWIVTLFLVNGQKEPKSLRDEAWLFQPQLIVEAPDGAPIFQRRPSGRHEHMTNEERAMAMLYRRHVGFVAGHGVSVHAETRPGDPTCAVRLSTSTAPAYDLARTDAPTIEDIPALADLVLDMQELAESAAADLAPKLLPLVTTYAVWIAEQQARIADPAAGLESYQDVARETLAQCRQTLQRIRAGIDLLGRSEEGARAFAFMNRAMWQQRLHTLYAEERRRGGPATLADLDQARNRSWRPFQLAFILLNLPALTDLHHPERSTDPGAIADLLWFPTGGGKTEAYLGLTAYTLAIRRLQGTIEGRSGHDGVAVIMRYTLRLLTLQQFQRASSLICACELIRRADPRTWGETPFRLGLWVGQRSTPNTTEESAEANRQEHGFRGSLFGGSGSPRQLTNCPWCGSPIEGGKHIEVETFSKGRGRTLIYCSDPYGQCAFSKAGSPGEGLPVLVVDEEIYRLLPALLIATVDKFAQLPWKGATQMLFGQVNKKCSRHGFRSPDLEDRDKHPRAGKWPPATSSYHAPLRPPDLIIQDELHLISGPLGSLVGLYETIIDHLATWTVGGRQVRPKVIAATATIRRAEHQVQALFLRTVNVFPPQGLDVEDNFFSRQRPPTETTPGRRYIGICANGRRLKAALIRVYVAYLSAAQALYNKYGAAADPWMTLVGYFNSMSELGGMRRLVDDDVRSRLSKMDQRGLANRRKPTVEELTSRKSSTAIPEVLNKLEHSFGIEGGAWPLDVLLATNMISVGVDVQRLGLMAVTGQLKTTAEYIQATSRVGRNHPGLICVVYNWARPRDLSHYEQFEHYHATFYQQVEALSVTPFAPRALDRGLAALLTGFVRLSGPEFSQNEAAREVTGDTPLFAEAIAAVARRAGEITNDEQVVERVRTDLEKLKTYWLHKAETTPGLGYKTRKDGQTLGLLKDPERGGWEPFTCLNSLREVEPAVYLILDERGLGESEEQGGAETAQAEEGQPS